MTFNRDFDSRGVRAALDQDCRDWTSDDAVTTAERLKQPLRQEMKHLYQTQIRRRIEEDPANRLLNSAYRQQLDVGANRDTPLIGNLCSGAYYQDRLEDGRRVQHRELLKPHGLASRGPSRQGSYNQSVMESQYQPPQQHEQQQQQQRPYFSSSQPQSQLPSGRSTDVNNNNAMPPPCVCNAPPPPPPPCYNAAATNSARSEQEQQHQQQQEQQSHLDAIQQYATTAPAARGPEPSSSTRFRAVDSRRPHSRLGMTFPLRDKAKVAPNPIALLEARRFDEEQRRAAAAHHDGGGNNKTNNNNEPYARRPGFQQQQQQQQRRPASAGSRPSVPVSGQNSGRGSNAAAVEPLAVVGTQQQQQQQQQPENSNPDSGRTGSRVNTGRSHTDSLKHGNKKVRGEIGFGQKTNVDKYYDPVAVAEEERRLQGMLPKKEKGPQLVPAVATAHYPTSSSLSRKRGGAHGGGGGGGYPGEYQPHPSAQRYAVDAYTSAPSQRHNRVTYSPARGSLQQYTQGLFVDGQQVLKAHDMPKVGCVDVNAIASAARPYQRRPASAAPAMGGASREFYS